MSADNGDLNLQRVPIFRIVIEYTPTNGQMQVAWPQMDDIGKLGLLEAAKMSLLSSQVQRNLGMEQRRIVEAPPGIKLS